jgi:putative nucleotidyltransferase with HDIG domain
MKDKLDTFIDSIEHLPPSPRLLVKLLEMFKDPDLNLDEVVRLLSYDPSFTAEVLKRCNSAYFGGAKPAEDMLEAVSRLGLQEIYNIVLAMFAASAILQAQAAGSAHVEILWRHSVAVAVGAEVLANGAGECCPTAFTAGLLHEVGKVIMVSKDKTRYALVVENAAVRKRSLIVTEREQYGFDHAEAGARLLGRWSLPPNIVEAVRHHHDLAGAGEFERLAAMVQLANLVAHATGEKMAGDFKGLANAAPSMAVLGLTPEKVTALLPAMQEGLSKAKVFTLS